MASVPANFRFTVFTPTYNRADCLTRVWESLSAQTFRDFEWLIIDDGSTDNTRELVDQWKAAAPFPVRYFWQAHKHKKAAINRAIAEAQGELLIGLDSDDRCVPTALERLWTLWTDVPDNKRPDFAGLTVLCVDQHGRMVGDRFPGNPWIDCTGGEMRHRWQVKGEKFGFVRTDVIRQFTFPEDVPGYVPETYVWRQVDRHYLTRFVNEALRIYFVEEADSITSAGVKSPASNADGGVLGFAMDLREGIRWWSHDPIELARIAAILARLSLHSKLPLKRKWYELWTSQPWNARLLLIAMTPVGAALWLRDVWRSRRARRATVISASAVQPPAQA